MEYFDFLNKVIDRGIAAATEDYKNDNHKSHLDGSIAGFEACRNRQPHELREVWSEAADYLKKYYGDKDNVDTYWWYRCYQLEVEWVCNCVSACLLNKGIEPILSWLPTCNGMVNAAKILNQEV